MWECFLYLFFYKGKGNKTSYIALVPNVLISALLNYQRHLLIFSCASLGCCFYKGTLDPTSTEFNWHEWLNIFINFTFIIETGCLIPMSYWCDKTWYKVKSKEHHSCTKFPVAMLYYHSVLYEMSRLIYKYQNLSSCFNWR